MGEKKYDVEVKDNKVHASLDPNKDGQDVVKVKLAISEAIQEAVKQGKPVEGAKVVDYRFGGTKLYLTVDTDRDGDDSLELEIDLAEAMDEADLL